MPGIAAAAPPEPTPSIPASAVERVPDPLHVLEGLVQFLGELVLLLLLLLLLFLLALILLFAVAAAIVLAIAISIVAPLLLQLLSGLLLLPPNLLTARGCAALRL